MATVAGSNLPRSPVNANYRTDQGFFLGLSVALSILIVVGFGQLAVRGITDPVGAPIRVHVHALLLICWLATFCLQNWLAYRGTLSLHRRIGWAAILLAAGIVASNYYVTIMAIVENRGGVGEIPSAFLALGTADTLTFAGLIAWALILRQDTQWHRRLMFGATIMLSAAGINRWLALFSGPIQPILSISTQLTFVAVIAWHDHKVMGHVHRATIALVVMVAIQRAIPIVFPLIEPWNDFVASILG